MGHFLWVSGAWVTCDPLPPLGLGADACGFGLIVIIFIHNKAAIKEK